MSEIPDGWTLTPREDGVGVTITTARGTVMDLAPAICPDAGDVGVTLRVRLQDKPLMRLSQELAGVLGRVLLEWSRVDYGDAVERAFAEVAEDSAEVVES